MQHLEHAVNEKDAIYGRESSESGSLDHFEKPRSIVYFGSPQQEQRKHHFAYENLPWRDANISEGATETEIAADKGAGDPGQSAWTICGEVRIWTGVSGGFHHF